MINFDKTISMYDKFVDKDELTTKELYELGFNKHDLAKFVEQGKLKRIKRGVYTICSSEQMLFLVNYLVGKGKKERAGDALQRTLEFFPNDQKVNSRVFLDSIFRGDYKQTFECLDIMMESDNMAYKQDQNFWLYLLSVITEVPDRYKDKVKKMTVNDLYALSTDMRYDDKEKTNIIRKEAFKFNFNKAKTLNRETSEYDNKLFSSVVTSKLLSLAKEAFYDERNEYSELAKNKEYFLLADKLYKNGQKRKLSFGEICALMLTNDLIFITYYNSLPIRNNRDGVYGDFYNLISSCDYVGALEKNINYSLCGNLLEVLLETAVVENNKLLASYSKQEDMTFEDKCFYNVILHLKNNDVDKAIDALDYYLKQSNKSQYKYFVEDLIKLDVLDKDFSFFESILTLSKIRNGNCDFSVSVCVTDFYYQMNQGNYKKAALYLDILSMASLFNDAEVNVEGMKDSLINAMSKSGLDENDFNNYLGRNNEEKEDDCSYLADIFERVIDDKELIMLSPLDEDDANKVIDIASKVHNISSIVVDEDGKKRIFFRYFNKNGDYIPIKQNLTVANRLYYSGDYEGCIELYESVLSKIEEPRSFIYERLGLAYYKITEGNDFTKAINYLTLARANGFEDSNMNDLFSDLKNVSSYNGLNIADIDGEKGKVKVYS